MKTLALLISLFIAVQAIAQTPTKFQTDVLQFGRGASLLPKELIFDAGDGASNKKFSLDPSDNELDLNATLNITGNITTTGNVTPGGNVAATGSVSGASANFSGTSRHQSGLIMGTGTDVNRQLTVDRASADTYIKWNEATDRWVFTNDGTIEKNLGSGSGSGSGGINLLVNPSFEDGATNWAAIGGGTFSVQSYTNGNELGDGLRFGRFVASASGQKVCSDYYTVIDSLGPGGMADLKYNQGGMFIAYVEDVSANKMFSQSLTETLTTFRQTITQSFRNVAAGSTLRLCLESTAAGTIDFDAAYSGGNKNIGPVNCQGTLACETTFAANIGSSGDVTNNTLGWLDSCSTAATTITCTYSAAMTGVLTLPLACTANAAGSSGGTATRVTPVGTTTGFTFTTTAGGNTNGTSVICHKTGADIVRSKPTSVVGSDQSGWFIDVNIGGANPVTSNVASYTPFEDAALDLIPNTGSAAARIPCSSTNPPTGPTCAVGNEQVGVAFTPPFTGYFDVCLYGGFSQAATFSATTQWVRTAPNSQTILEEGKSRMALSGSANTTSGHTNCGTFLLSSVGETALRFAYEANSATHTLIADRNASQGQRDIRITVTPNYIYNSRPILTGEQVTNRGGTRTEIASVSYGTTNATTVCSASPCSYFDQIGTPATQVTRTSAGVYALVFGATYSKIKCASPSCSLSGGLNCVPVTNVSCSNCSSVTFITSNFSGTATDSHGTVNCVMVP